MSLVISVITDDFALMAADTRAISKRVIVDYANKLIRVNENIMFGCTGGVNDNLKLFEGFCECSNSVGFQKSNLQSNISYNEFIEKISSRFYEMKKEHEDIANNIFYDIQSIVCGYNGNEFEIVLFDLSNRDSYKNIIKIKKSEQAIYGTVSAGNPLHYDILRKYLEELDGHDIEKYIQKIKNVFVVGKCFDYKINDNVCIEIMKK